MSVDTSRDVSLIQDEDVLRKMWLETEDFGRKKEIRSHMYKLREARLRDFYNTGEETTQTKQTSSTIRESSSKGCDISTHADSLADHSFLSLKSKEIRDSESPTRDVSYKISGTPRMIDQGWNVMSSEETSSDGKTHNTSRIATTSGTQPIDGGVSSYAAKSEQKGSVFHDGDDKNFTKSVGASSQNVIKQEASGGDENSKFHSSYTSTSSSSKHSSEQRFTSGDDDSKYITRSNIDDVTPSNLQDSIVRKTYTTDVPNDFKNHPSYIEGKTKVITETKTLPDGSIVTTTRYETKGGKTTTSSTSSSYSTSNKQVSSSEQKSSMSSNVTNKSHRIVGDSKTNYDDDNVRIMKYTDQPDVETQLIKTHKDDLDQNFSSKTSTSQSVKVINNQQTNLKSMDVEVKRENFVDDKEITRINDTKLLGRDVFDTKITRQDIKSDAINHEDVPTQQEVSTNQHETTRTTVVKHVGTKYDDQKVISDNFINVERHVGGSSIKPKEIEPKTKTIESIDFEVEFVTPKDLSEPNETKLHEVKPNEPTKFEPSERREPIKPGKSELDEKALPTDGQYDTTYRTEYVNKRISVEVSPTHDAFARSLRAVSPDRFSRSGSTRSLRTNSTNSVRNSPSPDKQTKMSPERHRPTSPIKKSTPIRSSPEKYSSTDTITKVTTDKKYTNKKKDEILTVGSTDRKSPDRKSKIEGINSDTITRKKKTDDKRTKSDVQLESNSPIGHKKVIPRSRSTSPTSIASDIEFVRHSTEQVTDLDIDETTTKQETIKTTKLTEERPSTLEITSKKSKKITERSPTSPLTDITSVRDVTKTTGTKSKEIIKRRESPTKDDLDTPRYFPKGDEPKDKVYKRTDTYEERCRQILGITDKKTIEKNITDILVDKKTTKSPEKKSSPVTSPIKEAPKKIKHEKVPSPTKLQESPSQIRRSPEKSPIMRKSPEKEPQKPKDAIQEFPSQIRKSPQREPLEPYPEKTKPTKDNPSVKEFPSQIRKSPVRENLEREPLEPCDEKTKPVKQGPSIREFPSQIKKVPEREALEPYPEKSKPTKEAPSVQEFPSQIRKSPQREPLEPYPEKSKPTKDTLSVKEFPSQIRRSPQREPSEPYPEKSKPTKDTPSVHEFPSQIRRSPQCEPSEPHPEKSKPTKDTLSVKEFPSQIRRSPQREPSEPYPEKSKPTKDTLSVKEFPSQIRRSPQREPSEPYPEKSKPTKDTLSVKEFPSQIRRSPQREPSEPYPEKSKPTKDILSVKEFPSQIRKSPQREPSEPYPEKSKPTKDTPSVHEFPSQIRRSAQREPIESYPEKPKPTKEVPSVEEFPSQFKKSPEGESLESYLEKPKPVKIAPSVREFPSQIRKSPDRISLDNLPETIKSRVSLDDIPKPKIDDIQLPKKSDKPNKTDMFIANEKFDTDITITKYKDDSVKTTPSKSPSKRIELFINKERVDTDNKVTKYDSEVSSIKKRKHVRKEIEVDDSETTSEEEICDDEEDMTETVEEIGSSKELRQKFTSKFEKSTERESSEKVVNDVTKIEDVSSQIKEAPQKEPLKQSIDKSKHTKKTTKEFPTDVKKSPEKESLQPSKVQEIPSKIKKSPRREKEEELISVTNITSLESRLPVDEQIVTKKFIKTLCQDEEIERKVSQKTQIVEDERINKTVKKDLSARKPSDKSPNRKKQTDILIKKERNDTDVTSKIRTKTRPLSPVKKIPDHQSSDSLGIKRTTVTKNVGEFVDETEYRDQYCKTTKIKYIPKTATNKITSTTIRKQPTKQTAVYNVGNVNNTEEDNSIVIKTFKIVQNGETSKTNQGKSKPKETPKKQDVKKLPSLTKRPVSPMKKTEEKLKQNKIVESDIQNKRTISKTVELKQVKPMTKTVQKIEIQPTRRHVVSTIINIKPKHKPESVAGKPTEKTTYSQTVTTTKTTKISPKITITSKTKSKAKPIQNGHVSDEDTESETEEETKTHKINRTKSPSKTPVRGIPRSEITSHPKSNEPIKKCITTKSILIENAVADEREIIVDLKRSKSSREGTPDRICPFPVTTNEDSGIPRYPDHITEPEDVSHLKPKRISDVPLTESENVVEFNRITEITDDKNKKTRTVTEIDRVQETDECLLSVNEKVNKFLNTAEQLVKPKENVKSQPQDEQTFLNVSDKVNKFVTTAEHMTTRRSKSPKNIDTNVDENDESLLSVSEKVSHFISTAEKIKQTPKMKEGIVPKVPRPDLTEVDENIRSDECLLSVSDKVTKFITTADKLTTTDYKKPSKPESKSRSLSPKKESVDSDIHTECTVIESEEQMYTRRSVSPEKSPIRKSVTPTRKPHETSPAPVESSNYRTPERRPSDLTKKTDITKTSKSSSIDTTPKSSRRPSHDEPKTILSPTGRLRSTETIKKAKALFENINKEQEILKQRDILSRPSVFEGRKKTEIDKTKDVRTKLTYEEHSTSRPKSREVLPGKKYSKIRDDEQPISQRCRPKSRDSSPDEDVPHYMTAIERHQHYGSAGKTIDELSVTKPRDVSPDEGDIPHYMTPLDRNQHESITTETEKIFDVHMDRHQHEGDIPHYMTPLDRNQHESITTETEKFFDVHMDRHQHEGDIPHYMTPLDRNQHESITTETEKIFDVHMDRHQHEGDIPHYMTPLDRNQHESITTETEKIFDVHMDRHQHEGDIPHYMTPLDRNQHESITTETEKISDVHMDRHQHEGDIPHYMTPLDRHQHDSITTETETFSDVHMDRHQRDSITIKTEKGISRARPRSRDSTPEGEMPHYMTSLDRQSQPVKIVSKDENTYRRSRPRSRDSSTESDVPHYMTPLDRSVHHEERTTSKTYSVEKATDKSTLRSRESTPNRDLPHYMTPLDKTLREKSPHVDNVKHLEKTTSSSQYDNVEVKTTKFGVTLRRTDSGRVITSNRRKSSTVSVDKEISESEVEEIFDLEYLEKLLETIVGYDIRRKIRAQIRIIKRLIEEKKLEEVIKKTTKSTSPARSVPKRKEKTPDRTSKTMERQTTYTKTNIDAKPNKLYQQTEWEQEGTVQERTEYKSSYKYNEKRTTSERINERRSPSYDKKPIRAKTPVKDKSASPERKVSKPETTTVFHTELKKIKPVAKSVVSDKPEWVTQRTLRKVSETSAPIRKVGTKTTKKETRTSSPAKEIKHTDVITSSYGVGPMDENGTPLFGLKALRAQNKSEKTKVQGTVIRSHYYAENGEEPVGEISVTNYSTDPKDLCGEELSKDGGISSVTTTQKFGYKGTPSLKSIKDTKKTNEEDILRKTKTSKVSRRGSVKEISQKFIENAVETLKSERQSSYPKAGLILRTSSFKDTESSGTGSSREGSPGMQEILKTVTTTKSSTTSSGKGDTFLSNKTKVTDVQDVITRMKNEDIEEGESQDDREARNLLNKFIGSQVILAGMESHVSRPSTTETRQTTTKVTTTTTADGGKPKTITRTFTHPITEELLETVWDEETLKLLLEQSTDYEDRRIIRARLRHVMAEQDACAELVVKASEDATKTEGGSIQEKVETTTKTFSEGPVTSQVTTRVTTQQQVTNKPISPFAKFRQLDKQNSLNSPPSTPKTPTGGGPLFKFTDPALNRSASTIKERLLQWCQMKTKEYENIQLDNFSTSWADGLAFCALIHHFLPEAFDYHALNPKNRRHNFTLAFQVADDKAGIAPLLDVDDMVATRRPDWKCVFTYVQSIYRRFKDED